MWGLNELRRMNNRLYRVIRFRQDGTNEVIQRGLTLEEAQENCQSGDTEGIGWFDGYEEE